MMTTESVSVILSVENAQNWLANDIEALIDCLADLTARFEIIVVDNASRDYTVEVLDELRSRFPQVRFRRFAERRLRDELIDLAMEMASGEFVFTTSPGARIEPSELRRLWALRVDPRLLVARSRTTARRIDAGLINRLTHWAQRVTAMSEPVASEYLGGLQMMRRRAVDELHPVFSKSSDAAGSSASGKDSIEISHVSHQQLASPKLVETRRRAHSEF